jgi:hypothetical protein
MTYKTANFHMTITTNEFGLRDRPLPENREQLRVLAVGDSFTFGYGVEGTEAWPAVLEALLQAGYQTPEEVRVINGGVSGYSLSQIRISTQELTVQLRPRLVILGLYPTVYWRIADPYVLYRGIVINKSSLEKAHVTQEGLLLAEYSRWRWISSLDLWFKKHFYFGAYVLQLTAKAKSHIHANLQAHASPYGQQTPGSLNAESEEEMLTPLLLELDRLHSFLNTQEIPLVVLLINAQWKDGTFEGRIYNKIVLEHCHARNVICIDPLPALESTAQGEPILRFGGDHHWTRLAHRIAAEELEIHIAKVLGLQVRN